MGKPKITLWQGLAKYAIKNLGDVSLEGKEIGDEVTKLPMKTIEDWKLKKKEEGGSDRISQFTLKLPGTKNEIAFCEKLEQDKKEDKEKLEKIEKKDSLYPRVAQISRKDKFIKFYKISETLSEIKCGELGYLQMENVKGEASYYAFKLETIRSESMMSDPNYVIAFVDGSSGGGVKNEYPVGDDTYQAYGGAYLLYRPGESKAFCKSSEAGVEPEAIRFGLKGISNGQGNVYGEINSAIRAIKKADELAKTQGFKKLRLYYDCEQIGGHAPGGAFENHKEKISKKYAKFWKNGLGEEDKYKDLFTDQEFGKFENLEEIELIHVDAHGNEDQELNKDVDDEARKVRDEVMPEFNTDTTKHDLLWIHRDDYKSDETDSKDSKTN